MNSNYTKQIEMYLSDELSMTEKEAFEKELTSNETLQRELEIQKEIHIAAERAAIRNQVKSIGKSYHFTKMVKMTAVVVAIVSLSALVAYKLFTNSKNDFVKFSELKEVKSLLKNLEGKSIIENLASEFFYWEGNDSILLSKKGVLLSIPKNAFKLNGKAYTGKAVIEWQEALDGQTIMKNGLSTMASRRLLETQGMISIVAYTKDKEKLEINPEVGIYIQVPVDEYKKEMKLFEGETDKEGVINWVKPRPLQKIPVPVDMKQLNFFPDGYEGKLDELKLSQSKKYRDSLYLSFDEALLLKKDIPEEKIIPFQQYDGKRLFESKCASCHKVFKDDIGPKLYKVRNKWQYEGAKDSSIYMWVNNWKQALVYDPKMQYLRDFSSTEMDKFPSLSREQIDAIFDYVDCTPISAPRVGEGFSGTGKLQEKPKPREASAWIDKISWSFSVKYCADGTATLIYMAKLKEGWNLFSAEHVRKQANNFGLPITFKTMAHGHIGPLVQVNEPITYAHKRGTISCFKDEAIFTQKIELVTKKSYYLTGRYRFQICNDLISMFPPDQEFTIRIKGRDELELIGAQEGHLPPSKVLAFWNPKFNNTILATREFESRMKVIHEIGDEKLLDLYTHNLSSSMEELDRKAVAMGYPQFERFVEEHVGALNAGNPHLKGLKKFYEKTIEGFRKELRKNDKVKKKVEAEWDENVRESRDLERKRTNNREEQFIKEEYFLNIKSVSKQLGLDSRKINHLGNSVGFQVFKFRSYNIDQIIPEIGVEDRKTFDLTDHKTGKKAQIKYNPFSFKVENHQKYDLVYAYLLPSNLNSYQRIIGRNGNFDYPLNSEMTYDLAIVGISDKGFYYKEIRSIQTGDLGSISLEKISENELDTKIQQMNKNRGANEPISISEELEWLILEQKNYIVEKQRQEEKAFRDMMRDVIFPNRRDKKLLNSQSNK